MNIVEYRELVQDLLFEPLAAIGFQMKGDHIYLRENGNCLALLRVKDKWSNITQQVKYLLVVRQEFLPDLEEREITEFVDHPALYPFKANPLKLDNFQRGVFKKKIVYKYRSCNLGHYDTANINYGEEDPSCILQTIASEVATKGVEWFHSLTPSMSAKQIRKYGNKEYIEEIWDRAYAKNGF
ncbi:hypothetical protein [Glaciecola sp. 1036]|uniref:hypothetical protein n=1 Tax=Alteromonadaceae TaxID=72275 RepID=UPI003CFC0CCD